VAFPAFTFPFESTVATFVLLLVHVTSLLVAFDGLTNASNDTVLPALRTKLILTEDTGIVFAGTVSTNLPVLSMV
jgi:hypothetical protein